MLLKYHGSSRAVNALGMAFYLNPRVSGPLNNLARLNILRVLLELGYIILCSFANSLIETNTFSKDFFPLSFRLRLASEDVWWLQDAGWFFNLFLMYGICNFFQEKIHPLVLINASKPHKCS